MYRYATSQCFLGGCYLGLKEEIKLNTLITNQLKTQYKFYLCIFLSLTKRQKGQNAIMTPLKMQRHKKGLFLQVKHVNNTVVIP